MEVDFHTNCKSFGIYLHQIVIQNVIIAHYLSTTQDYLVDTPLITYALINQQILTDSLLHASVDFIFMAIKKY